MHLMTKKNSSWFIVRVTSILTPFLLATFTLALQAQTEIPDTSEVADKRQRQLRERQLLVAALNAERNHDFEKAIESISQAMKAGSQDPGLYYKRGCWNFRMGKIDDSMQDFDKYVDLVPARANAQWERGITCYYANRFKAGAQQFVDYQTYHNQDVENAVWRYLCQVQFDGKKKSRKAILPIEDDRRVPMMEIYRLFRGDSTPQKVLDVLAASNSMGLQARHETFDAHLYLALFFDAEDELQNAKKHIELAVKQFKQGDYMWAVAVEHQKHIQRKLKKTQVAKEKNEKLQGKRETRPEGSHEDN